MNTLDKDKERKEIAKSEERLDQLFMKAFETNHPAMLDWVRIKFELKRLRNERNEQN